MKQDYYEVESSKLFSESLIWQLSREYYQNTGIDVWSNAEVPHQMTSNSMVGKTYAELILAFLEDLAVKGETQKTVYILELGAGHGRLAFHILRHLENLISFTDTKLPPYCYILSDIGEGNLDFFKNQAQLQSYYQSGVLDYAYYDAIDGTELHLRHADLTFKSGEIDQAVIAIANYFFDSIPTDLFYVKDKQLSVCSVSLESSINPSNSEKEIGLKDLEFSYSHDEIGETYYESPLINNILQNYKQELSQSYLFFPEKGLQCLENLKALSTKGLMLISMDKGFHTLADIDKKEKPDIIKHGSAFSLWVNYHALGSFCNKLGGKAIFPKYSTFHLEMACMMFVENADSYRNTHGAYQRYVDDFGPDDFISIKKLNYANISTISIKHLIAFLRLSAYDSTLFIKTLPRLKALIKEVSYDQRDRVAQTLYQVWSFYFNINESQDLANLIAGVFFDLGFYKDAVSYFDHSEARYGKSSDTCYNKTLCYYQLRQDVLFSQSLKEAKLLFPNNPIFEKLDELDLNAE